MLFMVIIKRLEHYDVGESAKMAEKIVTDFSEGNASKYWPRLLDRLKKPKQVGEGIVTSKWEVTSSAGMAGESYQISYEEGEKIDVYETNKNELVIIAIDAPGSGKHWMYLKEAPVSY